MTMVPYTPAAVVSIRRAVESDVGLVMRLVRACIEHMQRAGIDQWDDLYPTHAGVLADVRAGTTYVGLTDDGDLLGALVLDENQNPEYSEVPWTMDGLRVAVVHRLVVDPQYQRRGIARQLMRFVEEQARDRGCDAIRLDTFSANPPALRLYQRLGYHDAGCVTFRKGVFRCFEKRIGL
jgi:ribosomal protein S18 acetylase RimI-like enzyme